MTIEQNKLANEGDSQILEKYTVAGIQMVSGADWTENLAAALRLLQEGVAQGAKLLVLPENWVVFAAEGYREFARDPALSGQVFQALGEFCQQHDVWICAGSVPVPPSASQLSKMASPTQGSGSDADRAFTRCCLINEKGDIVSAYDKLHLFDVQVNDGHGNYSESQWFLPGESVQVVSTPFGRIGLAICYDLRFPELFRHMALQGAELFLVPSAFTQVTGQAHWSVLTRARAVENLAYVVATDQGGRHTENRDTWGHTCVVDPWGGVLAQLQSGEGVVTAEIDLSLVRAHRAKMPVLEHGRLQIQGVAEIV